MILRPEIVLIYLLELHQEFVRTSGDWGMSFSLENQVIYDLQVWSPV